MWTFGRKLSMGFALSFALLLLIGTLAYRGVDLLTQTSYQVTRTHAALTHVESLMSLMKDAETSQRGYLLSGEDPYLDPYRHAVANLPRQLAELRPLIRDNPAQQARLNQATAMIEGLMQLHKERIETRRNATTEAAMRVQGLGEGKRRMDELRAVISQMEEEENDLLRQRAQEVESAATGVRMAIV